MYDLHALIRENKVDDIQEAIAKGADINMQDAEGNTPLILALGEEEVKDETIECLLNYNPDVTITNYGGDTSLHLAVIRNNIKLIKALIEKGANINVKDDTGNTPLLSALWSSVSPTLSDHEKEVKCEIIECLLNYNPDVTITRYGDGTSLHIAVIGNNIKLIKALIEKGADINARDRVFQARHF
jgi:ankyrin repeat protein